MEIARNCNLNVDNLPVEKEIYQDNICSKWHTLFFTGCDYEWREIVYNQRNVPDEPQSKPDLKNVFPYNYA